jgi:hypothetical protein
MPINCAIDCPRHVNDGDSVLWSDGRLTLMQLRYGPMYGVVLRVQIDNYFAARCVGKQESTHQLKLHTRIRCLWSFIKLACCDHYSTLRLQLTTCLIKAYYYHYYQGRRSVRNLGGPGL